MISFFPASYPDELLYSVLARYFDKSGYMAYAFAAEDLFLSKTTRPNMEFLNQYTPEALERITQNTDMEYIVMKHTMFPYYARFLPLERRQKAFRALTMTQTNFRNALAIPKNKDGISRHLRYCPICVNNDRRTYGETYWHRSQQLFGVNICPYHHCSLINSNVTMSGKSSPSLLSAEALIPYNSNAVFSDNLVEIAAAEYINSVFQMDVDMVSDIAAGDFLHSRMAGTKYLSVRGEQRNIAAFQNDFCDYYKELKGNWFKDRWQFEKLFSNYICNTYEICLAALFLNIPAFDLSAMSLPEKSQKQRFDETIYQLHEQGMKYPDIAKTLNASLNIVKAIGERRYGTYHKPQKRTAKSGAKPLDWENIDKAMLPRVKEAIRQLQGGGAVRPKKVTVFAIEQILGIPCKRIDNLPLCKEEIQRHCESQPEYWAREVIWAANTVILEGRPFNWKHIRELTNIRRRDLSACMPYIRELSNDEMFEKIQSL